MNPRITVNENITLITLHNIPSEITYISDIFEDIAKLNVDVDMISMSPVQSDLTSLSFTINDDDLTKLLENSVFQKPIVSSGNRIISIFDSAMSGTPGFAAKVFKAASSANADIRIITTSEVQISILTTEADYDETYKAILHAFDE
ncbi:MAG: hypothetical protein Q8876_02780 [Bacillota bacterium]|nr:hypothetical protein [Bacillota bacterium]